MSVRVRRQFSTWNFCCPLSHGHEIMRYVLCSSLMKIGCLVCITINITRTVTRQSKFIQRTVTESLMHWIYQYVVKQTAYGCWLKVCLHSEGPATEKARWTRYCTTSCLHTWRKTANLGLSLDTDDCIRRTPTRT